MLSKLARNEPYYKRNRAHLCSFFLKGECTRGDSCPYRHELPTDGDNSVKQNIRDRYNGTNDPVAMKMLNRVKGGTGNSLIPPSDKSVASDINRSNLCGLLTRIYKIDYIIYYWS